MPFPANYDPIDRLAQVIRMHGPLDIVRVSSARASGRAKQFSYWDIVHYVVDLDKWGRPTSHACGHASSDRRSRTLEFRDAQALAERNGWITSQALGLVSNPEALNILGQWSKLHPHEEAKHAARLIQGYKKWTTRDLEACGLVGLYHMALGQLTPAEIATVEANELRIKALRQQRQIRKAVVRPVFGQRNIRFRWHGIEMQATVSRPVGWNPFNRKWRILYRVIGHGSDNLMGAVVRSKREAVRHWLAQQPKVIGQYQVFRVYKGPVPYWSLYQIGNPSVLWMGARKRTWLAEFIRKGRKTYRKLRAAKMDPGQPDTLGWRVWFWDRRKERLLSPHRNTVWETPELRVKKWSNAEALRGLAGIHACRMPYDWRHADIRHHEELSHYNYNYELGPRCVVGVVERFGKYVLGTEGWRAEIVVVRKLRAPTTQIGLALEKAYPEVEVYYEDR